MAETEKRPQTKVQPPLALTCRRLKNLAPELFDQFVNDLEIITADAMKAAVYSPSTDVLLDQGKARMCHWFLRTFIECTIEPKQKPTPLDSRVRSGG